MRKRKRVQQEVEGSSKLQRSDSSSSSIRSFLSGFGDLPAEILQIIFSGLPLGTIGSKLNLVCKNWKEATEDASFWRQLFVREFVLLPDTLPNYPPCPSSSSSITTSSSFLPWKRKCLSGKTVKKLCRLRRETLLMQWLIYNGFSALAYKLFDLGNDTSDDLDLFSMCVEITIITGQSKEFEFHLQHFQGRRLDRCLGDIIVKCALLNRQNFLDILAKQIPLVNIDPDFVEASFTTSDGPTRALRYACFHGNTSLLPVLSFMIPGQKEFSPLGIAAHRGHQGIIDSLLEYGALPSPTDLLRALRKSHWSIAEKLFAAGANGEPNFGCVALNVEIERKGIAPIKWLLEHGAQLHPQNGRCTPPLYTAIETGDLEITQMLIDAGADTNMSVTMVIQTTHPYERRTPLTYTPLGVALSRCKGDCYAMVEFLLQRGTVTEEYPGVALLVRCLDKPRPAALIALLLSHKADVNALDFFGCTALSLSVLRCFPWEGIEEGDEDMKMAAAAAIVDMLLDAEGQVHSQESLDKAFFVAFQSWYYDGDNMKEGSFARILLKEGASIDARGPDARTLLMEATAKGNMTEVNFLLDHGADVNAVSGSGHTPLTLAACGGHDEIVDILLAKNADVNHLTQKGKTAFNYALLRGYIDLAKRLAKLDYDPMVRSKMLNKALVMASKKNHVEAVKEVLLPFAKQLGDGSMDINTRDNPHDLKTPLMHAAERGFEEMVELLIKHKADLDLQNSQGRTALFYAVWEVHKGVAQLLLQAGAAVDKEECSNRSTPLHIAAWHDNQEMVELLLKYGADCGIKNFQGNTAAVLAAQQGHVALALFLQSKEMERESREKKK